MPFVVFSSSYDCNRTTSVLQILHVVRLRLTYNINLAGQSSRLPYPAHTITLCAFIPPPDQRKGLVTPSVPFSRLTELSVHTVPVALQWLVVSPHPTTRKFSSLNVEPELKKKKQELFLYEPFAISSLTTGGNNFSKMSKNHFCSSGGGTRTHSLWVMSPANSLCSSPQWLFILPPRIVPNCVTFWKWLFCFFQEFNVFSLPIIRGFSKKETLGMRKFIINNHGSNSV